MSNIKKNNNIEELCLYVKNFDNDICEMIKIREQIKTWCENGIKLDDSISPLTNQIELWKSKMKSLIKELKMNIEELKKVDDRIKDDTTNTVDLSLVELNEDQNEYNIDNWIKLLDLYDKLYINLVNDVNILENVKTNISGYEKLGVQLGNSIDMIKSQIENIIKASNDSSEGIEKIIALIKEECGKVELDHNNRDNAPIEELNSLIIKSSHIEEYSGSKKEVEFDHSVIQNNESKFELEVKFLTNNTGGHAIILGGGEGGNRFYIGWQTNNRGEFMVGLGGTNVCTINKYNELAGKETTVRYIQYGDKTGRFVINGIEEDILNIPEYTYTSTGTFYYNGHYNGFAKHNGTTYEYILYGY